MICSLVQDAAWYCLPCFAAVGFTGLSFLEGPLKDCTKTSKSQINKIGYPQGYAHTAIRSPQSSLLAQGGCENSCSKTICIIDIIDYRAALVQKD